MVYFSGVVIRLETTGSESQFIGALLLIITISLFVFSFHLQRSSGSAMGEVELIMAESERREQELHLDVFEMRSDMKNLQFLLKTNKLTDKFDPHPSSPPLMDSSRHFRRFSYHRDSEREGTRPLKKSAETSLPKKCVLSTSSLQDTISLSKPLYPCYVMSLKNLQTLSRLITHEEALEQGLLEKLTASTRRPSCAFTYFISQTWEGENHPDNARNTKLHWLKNLRDHFQLDLDDDVWLWFDLFSVPQKDRKRQKHAILSLCVYANLCSRFIPLVRDPAEWEQLYGEKLVPVQSTAVDGISLTDLNGASDPGQGDIRRLADLTCDIFSSQEANEAATESLGPDDDMMFTELESIPGTLHRYLRRGWCRLEIVAALCPKRSALGSFSRPGPINIRFRYHHNPEDPGVGPTVTDEFILSPFDGDLTVDKDRPFLLAITNRIAREYSAYEASHSSAWDLTLDIENRPKWLKQAALFSDEINLEEALTATEGAELDF